jgi:TonB family protein
MCLPDVRRVPKIRFDPAYPRRALQSRTEGWVIVQVEIRNDGTLARVAVREAFPRGIFEKETLQAVRRWRYSPVTDSECKHMWVEIRYAFPGGQITEVHAALREAGEHFSRCEFSAAAAAARRARSDTRNPQIFLAAALIEAAGLEVANPGSATDLLEAYADIASDLEGPEPARRRALNLIPEYCLD